MTITETLANEGKEMSEKIIESSGNVFHDLGIENAQEHQIKAELALEIIRIIERRNLTQKDAARLIGASQPDISNLKTGRLSGFALERLFSFLLRLNRDIEISIKRNRRKSGIGKINAVAA